MIGHQPDLSLSEARARAAQIKREVTEHGTPLAKAPEPHGDTLEGLLNGPHRQWISANQPRGAPRLKRLMNALPERLLKKPLKDLKRSDFRAWQSLRLADGMAPSKINRELAQLRSALELAVSNPDLQVAENPLDFIKATPPPAPARTRYLLDGERQRLYRALRRTTTHIRPMTFLALNTGLKRGEIFQLQWRDLSLPPDGEAITVRGMNPRTKSPRLIKLNEQAKLELLRWRRTRKNTDPAAWVFPGPGDKPLNTLQAGWHYLMAQAQIENFRFHDCRHDFACRLVMAGISLKAVCNLLGYSSIALTERYAHLAPNLATDPVDIL